MFTTQPPSVVDYQDFFFLFVSFCISLNIFNISDLKGMNIDLEMMFSMLWFRHVSI